MYLTCQVNEVYIAFISPSFMLKIYIIIIFCQFCSFLNLFIIVKIKCQKWNYTEELIFISVSVHENMQLSL